MRSIKKSIDVVNVVIVTNVNPKSETYVVPYFNNDIEKIRKYIKDVLETNNFLITSISNVMKASIEIPISEALANYAKIEPLTEVPHSNTETNN